MKHEKPDDILKDVCRDPLPSTTIGMTVTALPPNAGPAAEPRYLLTISPRALTFEPARESLSLNVRMAICEFDPKGDKFAFYPRDLSKKISIPTYKAWQRNGIRNIFDYAAKPQDQRLRFAVVDLPSGETGSVDVPAHPSEVGALPPKASVAEPPPAAPPASAGLRTQPSAAAAAAPPTHVDFRLPSGKTGSLDWSGDKLIYRGNLATELVVPAFFSSIYSSKFHCEAGKLTPKEPNGGSPNFQFWFHSPSGLTALVDLSGSAPVYSGNLPVEPSARAFFDRLWKLCHCQAP
jgi:hypothetical protein